jgi:two-component system chemotaxis response regulator CheB
VAAVAQERARVQINIVAIGASTGGPEALTDLIPQFPADFPAPIVIVQHMPAMFTRLLAERLDGLTSLTVSEAQEGKRLAPGQVWIAPGDYHMTVARQNSGAVLTMNQQPKEQGCRPSVDVLFRSVAETFGANVLAVVLTGMGADGTSGAQAIWEAGGEVLVQDEATSAIWGMPGRIVAAGLADCVYPLGTMASEVVRRAYARRPLPMLAQAAVAR